MTTGDSGIYYCTASSSDGVSKTASVQIQVMMMMMLMVILILLIMIIKVMFPPETVTMVMKMAIFGMILM